MASSTQSYEVQNQARFSVQPGTQLLSQRKLSVKVGGTENPAGLQTLLHRFDDPRPKRFNKTSSPNAQADEVEPREQIVSSHKHPDVGHSHVLDKESRLVLKKQCLLLS